MSSSASFGIKVKNFRPIFSFFGDLLLYIFLLYYPEILNRFRFYTRHVKMCLKQPRCRSMKVRLWVPVWVLVEEWGLRVFSTGVRSLFWSESGEIPMKARQFGKPFNISLSPPWEVSLRWISLFWMWDFYLERSLFFLQVCHFSTAWRI